MGLGSQGLLAVGARRAVASPLDVLGWVGSARVRDTGSGLRTDSRL